MSMTHARRAIVLVVIVHGLTGCNSASHSAPSSIPTGQPSPTPVEARAIVPDSGLTWRFTPVEILGAGFQPGLMVTFGQTAALSVRVVDSGTIHARAPMGGPGSTEVVVTTRGGVRAVVQGVYTFVDGPRPTLTPSAATVAPGGVVSAQWSTPTAGPLDWIGLFVLGSGNGETQSFGWRYTDNATTGTFTLTAPSQPGMYEFRYLPDDQYTDVARSSVVTVRQP